MFILPSTTSKEKKGKKKNTIHNNIKNKNDSNDEIMKQIYLVL